MKGNTNDVKPTVVTPTEVTSFKFVETHQDIERLFYWTGKNIKPSNELLQREKNKTKQKELTSRFSH